MQMEGKLPLMHAIRTLDSVTHIAPSDRGAIVVAGSHAGTFSGYAAAKCGARAVVLNDAGQSQEVVLDGALAYLEKVGIPAATVGTQSARIGWGAEMIETGIISYVNAAAAAFGCKAGQACKTALEHLSAAPEHAIDPPIYEEVARLERPGPIPVWCLDSISFVQDKHAGTIVISGSHGGLLGGRPETAVKIDVAAAVFHDAGLGRSNAGVSRLAALDRRNIFAAAVAAKSARAGDASSVYETGVLSTVNDHAACIGVNAGMTTREFVDRVTGALVTAEPHQLKHSRPSK